MESTSEVLGKAGLATEMLIALANQNCGGSKPAAAVLLSAYDSATYSVRVAELALLDDENYKAAMEVIRLRAAYAMSPHYLVKDGVTVFEEISERWRNRLNPQPLLRSIS